MKPLMRLIWVVCLAALPCVAAAAPSAAAMKEAKAHYAQGKAFQDAGGWDDAVREYETAYKLAPLPQLLFNIGQCQRLKGDKQKALDAYSAFLAAVPEGPASDDARDHIASLKLRIQVAAAEAARKRSAEEAEAARAQARAAEAARKQMEADEAARRRQRLDEANQTRAVAELVAEAEQRKREAGDRARSQRVAAAERTGRPLRIAGGAIAAAGVVLAACAFAIVPDGDSQKNVIQNATGTWTAQDQQAYDRSQSDARAMVAMWATGGALVAVGAVIGITGAVLRSRAVGRAQASASPLLSPRTGGLAVQF